MYHNMTVISSVFFILFAQIFCIFFDQFSRNHNLMTTSGTFETEIRTYPENLPLTAAAGMLLLQSDHISNFVYIRHFATSYLFQNFTHADRKIPVRSAAGLKDLHFYPEELLLYLQAPVHLHGNNPEDLRPDIQPAKFPR